jgi:glutamate dehydrogenase (NAD(P)+)
MMQNYKKLFQVKKIFPYTHKLLKPTYFRSSTTIKEDEEPDFLAMVKEYFDEASKFIEIPPQCLNLIKTCKAVVRFYFPLVRDDGNIELITGYRAQHSLHLLPTKGGTRYSEHIGK